MDPNPILRYLATRMGLTCPPRQIDPAWLLTLVTVLEVERFPLAAWNDALSAIRGRRIFCPSYASLNRYILSML